MIQFFFISKSTNSCVCCVCGIKQEKEKPKKRHSIKSDARLICYITIRISEFENRTCIFIIRLDFGMFWSIVMLTTIQLYFTSKEKKKTKMECVWRWNIWRMQPQICVNLNSLRKKENLSKVTCTNIYRIISTTPTGS